MKNADSGIDADAERSKRHRPRQIDRREHGPGEHLPRRHGCDYRPDQRPADAEDRHHPPASASQHGCKARDHQDDNAKDEQVHRYALPSVPLSPGNCDSACSMAAMMPSRSNCCASACFTASCCRQNASRESRCRCANGGADNCKQRVHRLAVHCREIHRPLQHAKRDRRMGNVHHDGVSHVGNRYPLADARRAKRLSRSSTWSRNCRLTSGGRCISSTTAASTWALSLPGTR